MAKFFQICASQDDLFALDEEGTVYQYNFRLETWVKLAASRTEDGQRPPAEAGEAAPRWTLTSPA